MSTLSPRQRWDERYRQLSPKDRQEPTAFVATCLPRLPNHGHALDIAAGIGRHSLALAQHGLKVDAVDISAQGLAIAQHRARATGLDIRFILADLEQPWLPQRSYEVILASFFLYRPLFPLIKTRLSPGGWLIVENYTTAQTTHTGQQPMRPEYLLKPLELNQAFADFEILFYDEGKHSRGITAQLLARKATPRK